MKLENENDLIFDSCFESGNLFAVYSTVENEYELIL